MDITINKMAGLMEATGRDFQEKPWIMCRFSAVMIMSSTIQQLLFNVTKKYLVRVTSSGR